MLRKSDNISCELSAIEDCILLLELTGLNVRFCDLNCMLRQAGNPPVIVLVIRGKIYQCQDEGEGDEHESKCGKRVGHALIYGFGLRESTRPIIVQVKHDSCHCWG